ncbi:elongator complex protein 3 [Marinisporobacter balticus]|uniref:Radical SAM family protein n=1 Tax=Marinisporobacter balticus TaxID=2018667 RepID=A0A4R2L4U9_9FIRM|nr:radical SAM protein [Marinisporobacter balticus]TCO79009.1 radical SAM family protein [Marinisporobacter balticus]
MPKAHYIIPIFVPHKGCPFDCVFCNQKKITGLSTDITPKEVEFQIEEYVATIGDVEKKHVEIAFFGGSFTGIEKHKQEELLTIASKWKKRGMIKDIRLSTRPDYINVSIMEFLKSFGVTIVELGVQSMDNEVLIKSDRGHTEEAVMNAVKIMRQFDVKIGLQMMIGLPGDHLQKTNCTVDKIIALSPDFVRIYPTLVVRDTYLEKMYLEGKYKPLSVKDATDISKGLLLKFLKKEIPVIRIGLQPTENILLGKEVIAGPFHPSFRQLVESEIFKDMLDYLFSKHEIQNRSWLELQVNDRTISSLVGHKKTNMDFIKNKYKIKRIKISRNNRLENGKMKVSNESEEMLSFSMKQYADNVI